MEKAAAHHNAGRFAEAETLYRQVLSAIPDHLEARMLLGAALNAQGRPAEAEGFLTSVADAHPDLFDAVLLLAMVLGRQEKQLVFLLRQ